MVKQGERKYQRRVVVNEAALAAAACWDHYSDNLLSAVKIRQIQEALEEVFPKRISMEKYHAF